MFRAAALISVLLASSFHLSAGFFSILDDDAWPAGSNTIILTFDDGPNGYAPVTAPLLDVLKSHNVKATFCLIGRNAEKFPELTKRIIREGHQVANHTYEHRAKSLFDGGYLKAETKKATTLYRKLTGEQRFRVKLFRPPLGLKTPAVRGLVDDFNYEYAHLTFFINDARLERDGTERFMRKLQSRIRKHEGAAIVLHEMRYKHEGDPLAVDKTWLPEFVDELIVWAKSEGYRFALYFPDLPAIK